MRISGGEVHEMDHLTDGGVEACEHATRDDGVADVEVGEVGDTSDQRDIGVVDAVTCIDLESGLVGMGSGLDEAMEFEELRLSLGVRKSAGVQFDHIGAEGERCIDLSVVGFDEHADSGADGFEGLDGGLEVGFESGDIESAFGGDFLTIFWDEAGFCGARFEGDLDDFWRVTHLEVESEIRFCAEGTDVGVLDVSSIGAEVDGDTGCACVDAEARGIEDERFGVVGEGCFRVAGLAQGCDVIDVEAEMGHGTLGGINGGSGGGR